MKPKPLTDEDYLRILYRIVPSGWIPCGHWREMLFKKNGKRYDLSAADLEQLERIERQGLFVI